MTTFRIGQLVIIVGGHSAGMAPTRPITGEITKVTSPLIPSPNNGVPVHCLALQMYGRPVLAEPAGLEPYHPPSDYQTLEELLRGVVPAGEKRKERA